MQGYVGVYGVCGKVPGGGIIGLFVPAVKGVAGFGHGGGLGYYAARIYGLVLRRGCSARGVKGDGVLYGLAGLRIPFCVQGYVGAYGVCGKVPGGGIIGFFVPAVKGVAAFGHGGGLGYGAACGYGLAGGRGRSASASKETV